MEKKAKCGHCEGDLQDQHLGSKFKRELTRQFYPMNVKDEARGRLRHLQRNERLKPSKKKSDNGNGGGDHHASKEHKFEKGQWNSKAPNEPKDGGKKPPLKCFFCESPNRARECPKKVKLDLGNGVTR